MMRVELMSITPQKAAEWLALNTHNRNLRSSRVTKLAGAIERGEWQVNGETIKLNGTVLIDGQHRLAAIIKAGKSIKSLVVFDAPTSAGETVDLGAARTLYDILHLRGEKAAKELSAAIGYLWREERGLERYAQSGQVTPTVQQGLQVLERHPGLRDVSQRRIRDLGISDGLAKYLRYRFEQIDAEDAAVFFEKLTTGADLEPGDPILAVRNRILSVSASHQLHRVVHQALLIKAWNAWRRGERLMKAHWSPGGSHAEPFPKIAEDVA